MKTGKYYLAIAVLSVSLLLLSAGCETLEDVIFNSMNGENEVGDENNKKQVPRGEKLQEDGFNMHLPEDWTVAERISSTKDTVEVLLESSQDDRGRAILTYFSPEYFSQEEAKEEAVKILSSSLYHVDGDIAKSCREIGNKKVAIFSASAGEKETMQAQTAVISGEAGHVLLTLITREEAEDYFLPYLEHLITGLDIS